MSVKRRICVVGGTGFVGQHLVVRLADEGHYVKVLARHRERHRDLLVLPSVHVVEADVRDEATLLREFRGMDVVVNLVGILNESGRARFRDMHVELPRRIMAACRKSNIKRLLHMSALGADAGRGASQYLRTKGEGENAMHAESGIAVTSFRPSVIFGPEDDFFNRFVRLLKITPYFFPLACPQAKLAPVYVGDVVEAFARALNNRASFGQRYDLCGPRSYSLKELVEYAAQQAGLNRCIVGLGKNMSSLLAGFLEMVPGKPMSSDNLASLRQDSVCKGEFPPLFTLTPASIEAVVPMYLARGKRSDARKKYLGYRERAGRE